MGKKIRTFAIQATKDLFFAIIIAVLLKIFVVEAREIPTGSMIPTINLGERVLVDKLVFRLDSINREDIIVFAPPETSPSTLDYIKRVIGLPGETVEIRDGYLYINGEMVIEPYLKEKPRQNFGPITVPHGNFFVLGDNRNNSEDSRVWGFVPCENVKGRAFLRYWPLERLQLI